MDPSKWFKERERYSRDLSLRRSEGMVPPRLFSESSRRRRDVKLLIHGGIDPLRLFRLISNSWRLRNLHKPERWKIAWSLTTKMRAKKSFFIKINTGRGAWQVIASPLYYWENFNMKNKDNSYSLPISPNLRFKQIIFWSPNCMTIRQYLLQIHFNTPSPGRKLTKKVASNRTLLEHWYKKKLRKNIWITNATYDACSLDKDPAIVNNLQSSYIGITM